VVAYRLKNEEKTPRMSQDLFKRKGCLIALLVSLLLLGLLYTQCAFTPTGYQRMAESNRAARQALWDSRFAPRQQEQPDSPPRPDSVAQVKPQYPAIDPEVFLQGTFGLPLLQYDPFGRWRMDLVAEIPIGSGDFVFDPANNTLGIHSSALGLSVERLIMNINTHIRIPYENGLGCRLGRRTDAKENERPPSSGETREAESVKSMDFMEKMLSDERWDRVDFFDLTHLQDWEDTQFIFFSEKTCLALFRVLQRGDLEKAVQLIERYVQLSGKCLFVEQSEWISYRRSIALERFLFALAAEPKAPEAMLERIATTLASWKLDPQEYADLQTANINRCRDLLVASLKASSDPQYNRYWESHKSWTRVPLKALEKAGISAAEPILWKAIDRKALALIHQDAAEYQAAHSQMRMAMNAISIARKEGFRNGSESSISLPASYVDLLEKDGLAYDYNGKPLKDRKSPPLEKSDPTSSDSDTATTLFAASFLENTPCALSREGFNRKIETIRFVFATARYHREHGRYPESAREMIPRYLDESFAASPEKNVTLLKIASFDLIVPPEFDTEPPSLFTRLLAAYRDDPPNSEKWPTRIEDLKPYAKPGEDPTPFAGCFVHLAELPVFVIPVSIPSVLEEEEKRKNAKEGKSTEVGKYLSIHVMLPPLNLDGVPGYLPAEPKGGN